MPSFQISSSGLTTFLSKKKKQNHASIMGYTYFLAIQVIYLIFSDYVYELKLRSKNTGFDAKDCTLKPNCSIKCIMKKTNNVVSNQVLHKTACTSKEDG